MSTSACDDSDLSNASSTYALPSVANLESFDGHQLEINAARGRVFIAWLLKRSAAANTAAGGWALLQCT